MDGKARTSKGFADILGKAGFIGCKEDTRASDRLMPGQSVESVKPCLFAQGLVEQLGGGDVGGEDAVVEFGLVGEEKDRDLFHVGAGADPLDPKDAAVDERGFLSYSLAGSCGHSVTREANIQKQDIDLVAFEDLLKGFPIVAREDANAVFLAPCEKGRDGFGLLSNHEHGGFGPHLRKFRSGGLGG